MIKVPYIMRHQNEILLFGRCSDQPIPIPDRRAAYFPLTPQFASDFRNLFIQGYHRHSMHDFAFHPLPHHIGVRSGFNPKVNLLHTNGRRKQILISRRLKTSYDNRFRTAFDNLAEDVRIQEIHSIEFRSGWSEILSPRRLIFLQDFEEGMVIRYPIGIIVTPVGKSLDLALFGACMRRRVSDQFDANRPLVLRGQALHQFQYLQGDRAHALK